MADDNETLRRYVRPLCLTDAAALGQRSPPPPVRQVAAWITGLPGHLAPKDAARLEALRARCPEMDAAVKHVAGFARMIKDLSGDENPLSKWIGAVDADLPELRSFTAGLRRDQDAVSPGSPCATSPARSRAPSTASNSSRPRCTGGQNPISYANGYSWPDHAETTYRTESIELARA